MHNFFEKARFHTQNKIDQVTDRVNEKLNAARCDEAKKLYREILTFQENVKREFQKNKKQLIKNQVGEEILKYIEEEVRDAKNLLALVSQMLVTQHDTVTFQKNLDAFQQEAKRYKDKNTTILLFTKFYSRMGLINPLYIHGPKKDSIKELYKKEFAEIYGPYLASRKEIDDINKEMNVAFTTMSDIEKILSDIIKSFNLETNSEIKKRKNKVIKNLLTHIQKEAVMLFDEDKRKIIYDEFKKIKELSTVEAIMSSEITKYLEPPSLLKPLLEEFPDTFIKMIKLLIEYYEMHQEMKNSEIECKELQNRLDAVMSHKALQNKLDADMSNIEKTFSEIINSFPKLDDEMKKRKNVVIQNLLTHIKNEAIRLYSKDQRQITYTEFEKIKDMSTIEAIIGSGIKKYLEPSLLNPLLEEFPDTFIKMIRLLLEHYEIHQEMKNSEIKCKDLEVKFAPEVRKLDENRPQLFKIFLTLKKPLALHLTAEEKEEVKNINNVKGSVKNFRKSIAPQKGPG